MTISPLDIVRAHRRIQAHLPATPLRESAWLSSATGAAVHLKLESVQLTSAFKIRGALNACLRVLEVAGGDASRAPQIVTASAGNHGRALALVAERLGLRATIFTPRTAPDTKKAAIRRHGATLRDDPADYDAAEGAARAYARDGRALFISPYNHPDVIAGAGTTALEILSVVPALDAIVVPIGGGGLVSGIGTVIKACAPRARVIGVEASASTPFAASFRAGAIVTIEPRRSIADGLTGNLEPGAMTFDIARRVVDALRAVDEAAIADAIRGLAGEEHVVAEGAGAVATAAVLAGGVVRPGETAVVMVTGSNIDLPHFGELLQGTTHAADRKD